MSAIYNELNRNRVENFLEQKDIKQSWLAEESGISYNMVNGYIQNRQQYRLEALYGIVVILYAIIKEQLAYPENHNKD